MLSSVVLPQPLRPTTHTNSDSAISMVTSRSAGTVRSAASYSKVRWRSSMKLTRASSRAHHSHHAPPADGPALERLEDDALEDEPEDSDDDQGGDHGVGVEELLGVEDQPAEPPAGGGDHLTADYG